MCLFEFESKFTTRTGGTGEQTMYELQYALGYLCAVGEVEVDRRVTLFIGYCKV